MKLSKYIGISMAAFVALTQLTSCLKDNPNNSDPKSGGSNNVVEFQNTSIPVSYTSPFPQYDNGISLTNGAGTFPINLNYTGPADNAPQDIKITLALSQSSLDSFNNAEGTSYVIPPSDTYAMTMTPVIAKGTRQIAVVVTVNTAPADYDYNASYCLPLTIASASYGIISSNFGTAMYTFIANNAFAGKYTTTGYFFHPSSPRSFKEDYTLYTAGQFVSTFPFGDLPAGGTGYYFNATIPSAGGALTNYVANGAPAAPASGFMTQDNPGGFYSGAAVLPGTNGWTSTTYNNTYDATNLTFWIHVGYASGGNGQSTYSRQVYEKMVHD